MLQKKHQEFSGCSVPILYAGDIFNQWNASPEVINFALANLPEGWAIPGQHDLPNHNYEEIKRSAYWTLVEAGLLTNLEPDKETEIGGDILATGFPWGFDLKPPRHPGAAVTHIAVIHHFIWTNKETGYPGAPEASHVKHPTTKFTGYDVEVYGDNHKGFLLEGSGTNIFNCGALMRRKTDERNYRPGVGLLHTDGTVTRHYLDTSQDKFIQATEAEEAVEKILDMTAFVSGLRDLETNDALDFVTAVKWFLKDNKVVGRVAEIILEATVCG